MSRKRIFGAALASALVIGIGAASIASGAPAAPALTLKVAKQKNVNVKWSFAALPTRDGSAIEIQRSANGSAFTTVQKVNKPKPKASWTDKAVPHGALRYQARLVVNNVAQAFGPIAQVTVGTAPTTTTTTTTTVAPPTSTTTTTTVPPAALGAYRWSRSYGANTGDVTIVDAGVAPDGDIVFLAKFTQTMNFGSGSHTAAGSGDTIVVRMAANGTPRWSRQYGAGTPDFDIATALDVDSAGAVYITGQFNGSVTFGSFTLTSRESSPGARQPDGFVVKLSSTGTVLWARSVGGPASDGTSAIAVNGNRVAVTGTWSDDTSGHASSVLFAVLDAGNGADVIAPRSEGSSSGKSRGTSVAIDDQGRITLVGNLDGTARVIGANLTSAGSLDIFMGQYNASGVPQWRTRFGGSASDTAQGIAVGPNDDLVLAGFFGGTVSFGGTALVGQGLGDIVAARYSSAGAHQWSRRFGTTWLSTGELVSDVTVDASGNVLLAGQVVPTIDFGTGPLSGVTQDPFLVKLGASGATRWAKRFQSSSIWPPNAATAVGVAPDGDVVVAGNFKFDIAIAPAVHRNGNDNYISSPDGFVARFSA